MGDASFTEPLPRQEFRKPPRILIIGAGSRGTAYTEAALSCSNAVIAAICEPISHKRFSFGKKFIWGDNAPQHHQEFADWKDWVAFELERRKEGSGKGVDAVFVCVLDELHEEVVTGIAPLGVHICCEKPLSTSLEACVRIWKALKESSRKNERETIFGICHVLRYSPHNMLLKRLVDEGVVGDVLSLEHVEPVGWWHFSVSSSSLSLPPTSTRGWL
jgi:predicted dehydrogenase